MLPTGTELLLALQFLARRFACVSPAPAEVERLIGETRHFWDGVSGDECAALFFCLSRRAQWLGALWARAPGVLANALAHRLALPVIPHEDLRTLRIQIAQRQVDYAEVREWFRARRQTA